MAGEERPAPIAIGISATLLGAISFQMALFYLTNHSDKDMRRYTYGVINQTVSIFCAVLLFQTCDDMVEWLLLEGQPLQVQAMVDMLHMLLWFTILQLVLAKICGVACFQETNKAGSAISLEKKKDLKCYSVLLAHLTGFASINAWGALQQLPTFSSSPVRALALVPVSAVGQLALQVFVDYIRESHSKDREKTKREEAWDEECEEAENDVMGLTLSFNITQAVRYWICGDLPDQHGKEQAELLHHSHSGTQVLELLCAGCLGVLIMVMLFLRMKREEKKAEGGAVADADFDAAESESEDEDEDGEVEEGREDEEEGNAAGSEEDVTGTWSVVSKFTDKMAGSPVSKEGKMMMDEMRLRFTDALTTTFGMQFAWCVFFGAQMWLALHNGFDDPMVLAVALALFISFSSFAAIRLLDRVDDAARETTNQFVLRSTTGESFLCLNPSRQRVFPERIPPHGSGLKARKTCFIAEDCKTKDSKGKGPQLVLKFGGHYVQSDGGLTDNKKGKLVQLEKIERNHNSHVRVCIGTTEYDLVPREIGNARLIDEVLKKVINVLGILVGFGWEQCFDEAVDSLSQVLPQPHIAKMLLALMCMWIILPAWKWYVMPMSEAQGWRFGFVVDHEDDKWVDIFTHLARNGSHHGHGNGHSRTGAGRSIHMQSALASMKSAGAGGNGDIDPESSPSLQTPLLAEHSGGGARLPSALPSALPSTLPSSRATTPPRVSFGDCSELAALRRSNEELKTAAESFMGVYGRLREGSDIERRTLLKSYNLQMDAMLARMRELQVKVARDQSPRTPR